MTIWAIDPGPHTGIFYMKGLEPCRVTLDYTDGLVHRPHEHLYLWLLQNIDPANDTIVYEPFEFRKEERDREYINYQAAEFVGVIALFCDLTNTAGVRQMAAQVMSFWEDDKLKRVGLYVPGKERRHERDATRHWLHYVSFYLHDNYWVSKLKR